MDADRVGGVASDERVGRCRRRATPPEPARGATVDDNATRELAGGGLTSATDGVDPLIGRTLEGKYRVESLLGVGGMGRVYQGRNERTDSPVAIKTLSRELTSDPSLVKRFEVEARSASNLRHPNTIRIYDFGSDQGVLFMVMELLSGRSVDDLIRAEAPIDQRRAAWIIIEACKSLSEAHDAGLVHRDLKPDNLFLNALSEGGQEHVKVLDFGVAKLRDKRFSDATLTQAGMIFGTPRYMSPEQARAQDLDGRSDIYALGVILFELLSGRPPFDAAEPIGLLIKHVNEAPPRIGDLAPHVTVDPELEALTYRCLAKEPGDRPSSVEELLHLLENIYVRLGGSDALRRLSSDRVLAAPSNTLTDHPAHGAADGATLGVEAPEPAPHTFAMSSDGDPPPDFTGNRPAVQAARSPITLLVVLAVAVVIVAGIVIQTLRTTGDPPPSSAAPEPPRPAPTQALAASSTALDGALREARLAAQDATIVLELHGPNDVEARAWPEGREELASTLPHRFPVRRGEEDDPLAFIVQAEGHEELRTELPRARSGVHQLELQPIRARRPGRDSRPDTARPAAETRPVPTPPRPTTPTDDRTDRIVDPY
ncbi:MAG: serine/threonine protein kinase [Deltaproteobacteria bacterium]|nr:MAG: serine/threonine protein kinase [Deltaproteobacteria bacterium]